MITKIKCTLHKSRFSVLKKRWNFMSQLNTAPVVYVDLYFKLSKSNTQVLSAEIACRSCNLHPVWHGYIYVDLSVKEWTWALRVALLPLIHLLTMMRMNPGHKYQHCHPNPHHDIRTFQFQQWILDECLQGITSTRFDGGDGIAWATWSEWGRRENDEDITRAHIDT